MRSLTQVTTDLVDAQSDGDVDRFAAQINHETKNIRTSVIKMNSYGLPSALVGDLQQAVALIAGNLEQQAAAVRLRLNWQAAFDNDIEIVSKSIASMAEAFDTLSLQAPDDLIRNGEALHEILAGGDTPARASELLDSILDDDAARIERLLEMRFRSRRLDHWIQQLSSQAKMSDLAETKGHVDLDLRTLAGLTLGFNDGPQRRQAASALGTLTTMWSGQTSPFLVRIKIVERSQIIGRLTLANEVLLDSLDEFTVSVFAQAQALSASSQSRASTTILWARIGLIAIVALLGSVLIGLRVIRRIANPIDQITAATLRLANGELDVRLPVGDDKEIADLTAALTGFRDTTALV